MTFEQDQQMVAGAPFNFFYCHVTMIRWKQTSGKEIELLVLPRTDSDYRSTLT
jgi:hypothetical protein